MKFGQILALSLCFLALGCTSPPVPEVDHPQLTPDVRVIDASLDSGTLGRTMAFRIILPQRKPAGAMPVVYLVHGAGVNYHDWTNNSQIASLAARGIILVLPNMPGSYYINQANGPKKAYEDFFVRDLMPEVHRLVPEAASDRNETAIVGISRGGYGSVTLGLKHRELFGFVGGLSPALDFAERKFRWHAPLESMEFRRIFGPAGSATRSENDPYLLVRALTPDTSPVLFLTCGDREVLSEVTRRFVGVAERKHLPVEFHSFDGKHDWGTWNAALPFLEASLLKFFGRANPQDKAA